MGLSGRTDELALWPPLLTTGFVNMLPIGDLGGMTWAGLGHGITSATLNSEGSSHLQAGSREASAEQGPEVPRSLDSQSRCLNMQAFMPRNPIKP